MSRTEQLAREAHELADSLQESIPLATTRIEHLRISALASRARHLAQELRSLTP